MSTATATASEVEIERQQQVRQAEELLFSGPQRRSLAKELFWGRLAADLVLPYPQLSDEERPKVAAALAELRAFCDAHLDPAANDRRADIPRAVIDGLARLGVLGMTAPESSAGEAFRNWPTAEILEELGSRCSATSIFVNAHHSIGMRALLLFGTAEQKRRWLPDLVSGKKLAAFALTEPQAGSDAANVQTTATPSADGSHYVLQGEKRYITNGAIADVLTVMARTPVPGRAETAGHGLSRHARHARFPDRRAADGEARHPRHGHRAAGVRGHGRAAREHPGPVGQGVEGGPDRVGLRPHHLRRCCTGMAKTCLRLAAEHARTRVQFGHRLGRF